MKNGQPIPFMEGVVGGRSVGTPGVLAGAGAGASPTRQAGVEGLVRAGDRARRARVRDQPATGPRLLREPSARRLRNDASAAAYFFEADGTPKAAGTRLRNPELAAVLRDVAERGAIAFHEGPLARDIVAKGARPCHQPGPAERGRPGGLPCQDARAVVLRPPALAHLWHAAAPLRARWRWGRCWGCSPGTSSRRWRPAQGAAGLEPAVDAVHLISEAGRLAFADRWPLRGPTPDFVALPGGSAAALLSPAYLAQRAALIGPRSMGRAQPGAPTAPPLSLADDRSPELPSTSHVSVVDANGNAVSMTTTIENAFGAQMMVRGFLLNNQLTDFSFVPSENGVPVANRVEAGKRPRSSMAPMLVFDKDSGELLMSVGSPGGSAIINYVAKVLVGTLDWGLDVQQAVALPNFGSRNGADRAGAGACVAGTRGGARGALGTRCA